MIRKMLSLKVKRNKDVKVVVEVDSGVNDVDLKKCFLNGMVINFIDCLCLEVGLDELMVCVMDLIMSIGRG